MKDPSSSARTTYDTTPATHGDLDIWGGRVIEMIDEAKEEVKTEIRKEVSRIDKRLDNHEERLVRIEETLGRVKDTVIDNTLLLKAIDKKLSKK